MEPLAYLNQYGDWLLLFARVVLGAIFFVHGWAKVKSAKGFYFWLGLWEVAWTLLITIGFLAHFGGIALALVMVGATYMKKVTWHMPFTAQDKTGYELDLALLALALLFFVFGAGALSLDAVVW